ncbi:MAG TPA: hypothetical protein DDW51_05630 [Cyanobacteria bacterium UBA11367]|nr:hypothetical protein [Cyanobacteria bacterium UBA11367]HBE56764.1 hypothetical protein [Cyanobacteria bacterium UBA11366]
MNLTQIQNDPQSGSVQNQQLLAEQAIRDRIGDIATPAAGTANSWLSLLASRFGDAIASPAANTLLARIQSLIGAVGNVGDVIASSPTSNVSFISLFKLLGSNFANRIPALTVTNNRLLVDTGTSITSSSSVALTPALTTTSSILAGANSSRKEFTIYNNLATTIYLDQVSPVTTTSFKIMIPPGAFFEHNDYVGIWYACLGTGSGTPLIRECT